MGCGCGGGKSAAARKLGTIPAQPLIYGEDSEDLPVRRVVLVQGAAGTPAGATRYVRGSEVDALLDNGTLRVAG